MTDDSGRVVMRAYQGVTEPANTVLNNRGENARLAGSPTELLTNHKHPLDGTEGAKLEALNVVVRTEN